MKYPLAEADKPVTVDTVKTGDMRRITFVYKSGKKREIVSVRGNYLIQTSHGPSLFFLDKADPISRFLKDQFVFVGTLKAEQFRGSLHIQGMECFHYQNETTEVWIAAGTMLPVAARENGEMARFQFLKPPKVPVRLSPEQSTLLKRHEAALSEFRAMR